jgi:glutathione S-transferase
LVTVCSLRYTYGQQFTYGDVALFGAINWVVNAFKLNMAMRRDFPKVKEFHDGVMSRRVRIGE